MKIGNKIMTSFICVYKCNTHFCRIKIFIYLFIYFEEVSQIKKSLIISAYGMPGCSNH